MFTNDIPESWPWAAALAAGLWIAALITHRIARPIVLRLVRRSPLLHTMLTRCSRALQWVLPLVLTQLLWQAMPEDMRGLRTAMHVNGVLIIAALTWLAVSAIRGLADGVVAAHPANIADNLQARRIHTQTRVLSRIGSSVALVVGLAFVLMTFPQVRQLGASLLASAGVAGLVLGIAARSVFGNLLAGLQIALAQ
ncbi:MAG TPA: mechanosensitive ion channel family protein, partial [Burkholderiaceae bacterium]|nr:mechanosensitive ion channel family protein [Burkholderiaceae bacterium]